MNKIITLVSTSSTNRDAIVLAEESAVHGTAVIAETQTMGRGRLGKHWQSPAGKGLYCSIILRPALEPQEYPRLTFVAGLAVAEVIERMYGLSAGLKWPNDIYFSGRKCGGILTESSRLNGCERERFVVVGIGLNVNTEQSDFHADVRQSATSLYIESGQVTDRLELFKEIREELLLQVHTFEQHGFPQVIDRWRKRDFMVGKRLSWVSVSGRKVDGISLGPDDDGLLHVRDDNGIEHEVLSGDIQLATH
jgi:BirA family biotin operon repressor/biotin-[acetyl-CoA-carboxylase] ligase